MREKLEWREKEKYMREKRQRKWSWSWEKANEKEAESENYKSYVPELSVWCQTKVWYWKPQGRTVETIMEKKVESAGDGRTSVDYRVPDLLRVRRVRGNQRARVDEYTVWNPQGQTDNLIAKTMLRENLSIRVLVGGAHNLLT